MYSAASVAGILMMIAAPAVAQTQVAQAQSAAATNKSDADRIVCKKEEQIGSRLAAKKVCLTVREWEDRRRHDREETERVQSGARAPTSG